MASKLFISVILPLRLEWNPCYFVDSTTGVKRGDRVKVRFAGKYYTGVVYRSGIIPSTAEDRILEVSSIEPLEPVTEEEIKLWEFISSYYLCTIGEVYKAAYPSTRLNQEETGERIARRLQERLDKKVKELDGLKRKDTKKYALLSSQVESLKLQLGGEAQGAAGDVTGVESPSKGGDVIKLSEAQEKAADSIRQAFTDNRTALLEGVTGSGKTEIYATLAAEALAQGRNVLYMVPEIALSRQLEDRLQGVFGDMLLVFHSGESFVRRREISSAVKSRQYIVLGTRSAIFLPHRNLGLVVVDEEHDFSYKQDSPAPRYNGRDCAVMLASLHGASVLLGSATPSFESLYNCMSGKYSLVQLKERYYGGDDVRIEIIDTIAERKKRGMVGNFSRKLISHIRQCQEKGGQTLILRGRKAYSPAVQCDNCGYILKCPHCNVPLSFHKDKEELICHYCGRVYHFSGVCPECGGEMRPIGSGTQKIEEELHSLFPDARIDRLDGDNASHSAQIIKNFAAGETDILVGTQMITKGFDFERLALVAVIQSDSLLGQFDFRADEKAIQLLEQLRGRSGRRGGDGLYVIQTSQPEHPVYRLLQSGEISTFMMGELQLRRQFGYPPFTRLLNIIMKDRNLPRLEKLSSGLASGLRGSLVDAAQVTGPYSPPVDKQSDQYIRIIRITLKRDRKLSDNKSKIYKFALNFERDRSWAGHIYMDVDPV